MNIIVPLIIRDYYLFKKLHHLNTKVKAEKIKADTTERIKVPPCTFSSVSAIFIPSKNAYKNKSTAITSDKYSATDCSMFITFQNNRVNRQYEIRLVIMTNFCRILG